MGGRPPICHECAGRGDEDEDAPLCCPACQCDAVNCGKKIRQISPEENIRRSFDESAMGLLRGDAP